MDLLLGHGEYLIISSCLKQPYNYLSLVSLFKQIVKYEADFLHMNLLDVKPEQANYNLIWEGVGEFTKGNFDYDELSKYVLSSVDILFKGKIPSRLQVQFCDELSYEVSLIFNYTDLIEEAVPNKANENCEFVEKLGLDLFYSLHPLYGLIAVEQSICGIKSIQEGECFFPSNRVFYSNMFIKQEPELFEGIYKNYSFTKILEGKGVYLRKTEISDFTLVELDADFEKFSCLTKWL